MKTGKSTGSLPWLWVAVVLIGAGIAHAAEDPSVVVHFSKGQSFLADEDKDKIRALFSHYALDEQARVFVLGYTDSSGGQKNNYMLSLRRAQSVRREIISAFGVDATIVVAIGKGEENPIADNRHADGQARNRRAEVYLANARERNPKRQYGDQDPYLPEIRSLVQAADTLIRQGQLTLAVSKLQQAHALGGDHYSDWHAARGIAGYFAHAPMEKTRAHLDRALRLDPHNFHAREFLSRVDARRKVASGKVSRQMGQAMETAITVSAIAQEHEYLRLFGVEPLAHRVLGNRSLDVWDCLDSSGHPVTYYFDYSRIYTWAFVQPESKEAAPNHGAIRTSDASAAPAPHAMRLTALPALSAAGGKDSIWASTVFK